MTEKQFIEKAIEGGWDEKRAKVTKFDMRDGYEGIATSMQSTDRMFLDPKAWKAVGKVEEWGDTGTICLYEYSDTNYFPQYPKEIQVAYFPVWKVKMHGMIDSLIGGKTIEDYLKTL